MNRRTRRIITAALALPTTAILIGLAVTGARLNRGRSHFCTAGTNRSCEDHCRT